LFVPAVLKGQPDDNFINPDVISKKLMYVTMNRCCMFCYTLGFKAQTLPEKLIQMELSLSFGFLYSVFSKKCQCVEISLDFFF